MGFVAKLQSLIAKKGLTQTAFESMVGLPANRISKWAGGQGVPTARQALRMSRFLGVPVEYLVDDEMDEIPLQPVTDRERQVWEIVQRYGAEAIYWCLVDAGMGVSPAANAPSQGMAAQDQASNGPGAGRNKGGSKTG